MTARLSIAQRSAKRITRAVEQCGLRVAKVLEDGTVIVAPYGFVYFIQNDQAIKIGHSLNWRRRIANLQVASPFKLKVLAVIPAPSQEEDRLHNKFGKYRIRGEWFTGAAGLKSYIAFLPSVTRNRQ